MSVNTQAPTDVGRWLDLERRRRQLEDELKAVVSEQERIRRQVLDRWSLEGVSTEKVDGYTVSLRRTLYPKVENRGALAMALQKEGLTDLLTVDDRALGAWIDAHEDSGVPLPASVAPLVGNRFERYALVVRLR